MAQGEQESIIQRKQEEAGGRAKGRNAGFAGQLLRVSPCHLLLIISCENFPLKNQLEESPGVPCHDISFINTDLLSSVGEKGATFLEVPGLRLPHHQAYVPEAQKRGALKGFAAFHILVSFHKMWACLWECFLRVHVLGHACHGRKTERCQGQ